ncbi:VOC family protein [Paremcibacter congregatus]|uniref:Glyoxalase n=1 Tax=Paremcibacter congregatus TaxID=2043170 RepID=A0A2G4YQK7_9PROT|nr:VOC family protein [Paremcibacter congregatus]PHZ84598.1 glyoxalase [Paremcibacter congregatus]QDE28819.1 VOC family protein [Paremcibacter congregatus]|tara:strand:+ start:801 stop:1292 length:492 start_codon:yes stop_codon:yes gene_type:complete
MTYPNTLIFVDLTSDDPAAAGEFYAAVFGWENDPRPKGVFHRMVPGQNFLNPDKSQSQIGNLHLGIHNAANARPHPDPEGVAPRQVAETGRKARIWVMVSDDDSVERILGEAVKRGAEILWRNHFWAEFNGFNDAFRDPWGNEIILWGKGGDSPQVPDDYTRE